MMEWDELGCSRPGALLTTCVLFRLLFAAGSAFVCVLVSVLSVLPLVASLEWCGLLCAVEGDLVALTCH